MEVDADLDGMAEFYDDLVRHNQDNQLLFQDEERLPQVEEKHNKADKEEQLLFDEHAELKRTVSSEFRATEIPKIHLKQSSITNLSFMYEMPTALTGRYQVRARLLQTKDESDQKNSTERLVRHRHTLALDKIDEKISEPAQTSSLQKYL